MHTGHAHSSGQPQSPSYCPAGFGLGHIPPIGICAVVQRRFGLGQQAVQHSDYGVPAWGAIPLVGLGSLVMGGAGWRPRLYRLASLALGRLNLLGLVLVLRWFWRHRFV